MLAKTRKHFKLSSIITVTLILSISANFILVIKVVSDYKSINLLRLDPLEQNVLKVKPEVDSGKKNLPKIILFGDSRIANWKPELVLPDYQIMNLGISGQTTTQLRMRLQTDVINNSPEFVILQAGINDLKIIGLFPNQREEIAFNCRENMKYMIDRISGKNIHVIVLTIFPVGKPHWVRSLLWCEQINDELKSINNYLKRMENTKIHIIDADNILKGEEYNLPKYKKDMLHLNHYGYEQLNKFLNTYLQKLVSK